MRENIKSNMIKWIYYIFSLKKPWKKNLQKNKYLESKDLYIEWRKTNKKYDIQRINK